MGNFRAKSTCKDAPKCAQRFDSPCRDHESFHRRRRDHFRRLEAEAPFVLRGKL